MHKPEGSGDPGDPPASSGRTTAGSTTSTVRLGSRLAATAIVLSLVGLALAPTGQALLSLDATTVETGDTLLSSTSLNHDTPSGSDRLLVVTASWDDANDASLNAVSYDGNALTCLSKADNGDVVASQICYLTAPPTGTGLTLDVGWDASVTEWVIVARSMTDVDQTNPVGARTTASGSSTGASTSLTAGEADGTIVSALATKNADVTLTPIDGTDEDADDTAGLSSTGISAGAGRTNVTSSGPYDSGWDLSDTVDWALSLAEVHRTPAQASFDQSTSSGDESTTSPTVDVSLDRESSDEVTVDYNVSGGDTSGADHNVSSGTIAFPANTTSQTLTLDVTDDVADEPDETLDLSLENPNGAEVGTPSTHTYTIADDDPNHAPDPSALSVSTDEDTDVSDSVSATDQDQNDTIDSYAVDTQPSHGSLAFDSSNGDFTYSPDEDYNGNDSFTFTATDEHGATSATATVDVTVNSVNDAPVAADDSASTDEDTGVTVDVLANDSDVDGDALGVSVSVAPSHGSASVNANGTITYTPDEDYNGEDSLDYDVTDGSLTDTGILNLTILSINDRPSASDDSASTEEDTAVWIDVLGNDSDPDGDSLTVKSTGTPSDGSVDVASNDTIKYTPDADFNGDQTFDYEVSDGSASDNGTVNVTVNPVNDPPSASSDSPSTDENQTTWVDVLANDDDVDGDSLSVDSVSDPSDGTTSLPGNGTVEYTPDSGFTGDDPFNYTVTDGASTDEATVSMSVTSTGNDAPSASDDSTSTDEDTSVWIDVLANDSDPDGDTLSVDSTTSPSHGSVSVASNDSIQYTPDADSNGEDTFDYDVTDGSVTGTATVTVTVNAVNDRPSASDDSASTPENETVWIDVLANDSDPEGDLLSVASATDASFGTTSVPGNGTVAYTPETGYSGSDGFSYTVSDGSATDTGAVSLTVGSDGGGGGSGGTSVSSSSAEVLSSNVRVVEGSLDADPTLNTSTGGSSMFLQLENATGGIGLGDLGATNDTTLEINLTTSNFTPTTLMGRTQVVDWTNSTNDNGTQNVSLTMQPISMAFIDDCDAYDPFMAYCGPSSVDNWPTDASEDQADVAFDAGMRVFLSDLSYLNSTMQDRLQGAYMTTDAQAIGRMNISGPDSPGGVSLTMPVAGPHTLPDGTQNRGFFEARLPDGMLGWWGIDDNSRLTGTYEGENRSVSITDVPKGTEIRMDIHYSSGTVNITEDTTDPTADAGANRTVETGEPVALDGSNSADNQGVDAYAWTLDDGSNATGATPNHTYESPGTYNVTLNVSDAAGNWDTDTVTVTVEEAPSVGGGNGGGYGGSSATDDASSGDPGTDDEPDERTNRTTVGGGGPLVPNATGGSEWDAAGSGAQASGPIEVTSQGERGVSHSAVGSGTQDDDAAASPTSDEGQARAARGGGVSDRAVEIGVWAVFGALIPISVFGIQRWAA